MTGRSTVRRRGLGQRVVLAATFLLLMGSTGCVVRYASHDLQDDWYDDKFNRGWFPDEVGLMTPNLPFGPAGLALGLESSTQDLDPRAVPPIFDWDDVKLRSTAVSARLFPINTGPFRPYGGGGYSRSSLRGRWTGPNYDPAPGIQCIGDCTDQFTEILHRGYNPFIVGGVELGGSATAFVFEFRRDLDRGDGFYRLSGDRFSIGLRWRTYSTR